MVSELLSCLESFATDIAKERSLLSVNALVQILQLAQAVCAEVALVTLVQLHVTQVVPPQVARHGAPAKAHYRALRAGKIWCISTVTFHMIFQVLHFTEANIASLPFTNKASLFLADLPPTGHLGRGHNVVACFFPLWGWALGLLLLLGASRCSTQGSELGRCGGLLCGGAFLLWVRVSHLVCGSGGSHPVGLVSVDPLQPDFFGFCLMSLAQVAAALVQREEAPSAFAAQKPLLCPVCCGLRALLEGGPPLHTGCTASVVELGVLKKLSPGLVKKLANLAAIAENFFH